MNTTETGKRLNHKRLKASLRSIEGMTTAQSLILSCYLDARKGKQACRQFARDTFAHSEQLLAENERIHAALAMERLQQAIDKEWDDQAQGLAILVDCHQAQADSIVLRLPVPAGEKLSVYTKADILPLLNLQGQFDNSTLLAFVDGVIQIYDIDLGRLKPVAWASAPHLQVSSDQSPNRSGVNKKLQKVCLTLLKSLPKPLIIAAHAAEIEQIRNWLPSRINWRLISNIILPYDIQSSTVMPFIRQQISQLKQDYSQTLATDLLNSLRFHGPALAGPASTIDALYHHSAQQLLLAENHAFRTDVKCTHCGKFASIQHGQSCNHCGKPKTRLWNPLIEASWMAYEQHLPVTLVDSNELNPFGGMACVTIQPQHIQRQSFTLPDDNRMIDLVA